MATTDQTSDGPDSRRVSLPRNVKDNQKVKSKTQQHNQVRCPCGNSAASVCKTKNCAKCCQAPACNAKNHKRKHSNYLSCDFHFEYIDVYILANIVLLPQLQEIS